MQGGGGEARNPSEHAVTFLPHEAGSNCKRGKTGNFRLELCVGMREGEVAILEQDSHLRHSVSSIAFCFLAFSLPSVLLRLIYFEM